MRNSIFKITGLTIAIALLSYVLTTYFNELNQAEEFNQFLSDAATISEIHNSNSANFKELLDFSEVSRERFESNINNIRTNSQEAYLLLNSSNAEYTSKEKQLLEIAVSSWLEGTELFEASIITLIDNPNSIKIEESIAKSIIDLSIGDEAYSEFLFLLRQNASIDGTFLPNFYQIEYIGIEDNSYQFADLLVDKQKEVQAVYFYRKSCCCWN